MLQALLKALLDSPWQFASAVAAWIALGVSIGPLLWRRLRPPRIDVDIALSALLKHAHGNPGLQLQVVLSHAGGRDVRVRSMDLDLRREGTEAFRLRAMGLFLKPDDPTAVLWAPFNLRRDGEWSYVVNFTQPAERGAMKMIWENSAALKKDMGAKLVGAAKGGPMVEGDEKFWRPLIDYFHRQFRWKAGQYQGRLVVSTSGQTLSRTFRFTVFETDEAILSALIEDYKYGFGVFMKVREDKTPAAFVELAVDQL